MPKENLSYKLHKSVEKSFKNLNKVAKWVKQSYETKEDVYCGNNNWTHIYNVFDLNSKNQYGIAISEWK